MHVSSRFHLGGFEEDLNLLHLLFHHFDLVFQHAVLVELLGLRDQGSSLSFSSFCQGYARELQFSHSFVVIHCET